MSTIQIAIDAAGGRQALADAIGVNVQFVHQMARGERPVPATRCIAIASASGGAVTPHDLRPDVFLKQETPA